MNRTSTSVYGENTGRKRKKLDEISNKSGRRMLKNTR